MTPRMFASGMKRKSQLDHVTSVSESIQTLTTTSENSEEWFQLSPRQLAHKLFSEGRLPPGSGVRKPEKTLLPLYGQQRIHVLSQILPSYAAGRLILPMSRSFITAFS
jgi:hypothetical protein